MNKIIIFFILVVLYTFRASFYSFDKNSRFLIASFVVMAIPFQINIPVIRLNLKTISGTIGPVIYFVPLLVVILVTLFIKTRGQYFVLSKHKWLLGLLFLFFLSLVNPFNKSMLSSFSFAALLFSYILLFSLLERKLTKEEILKGIYDGFFILCLFQFILAICFPVFGLKVVTEIFHSSGAESAFRQGGDRSGAIGVFAHPGNLALYTTVASSFFLASFLYNYKRLSSLIIILLNMFTLIVTYSRTTYLVFVIVILILFFIKKNPARNIISIKSFFGVVLPATFIILWIFFFSSFSSLFLDSDAELQITNRISSWLMALQAFMESPFIGVGINSHLEYFYYNDYIFNEFGFTREIIEFFLKNPIHNIHFIVAVEMGIIGFIFWIVFLVQRYLIARKEILKSNENEKIIAMTQISVIITFSSYGLTGWAPFSAGILPFFFMFFYFFDTFQLTGKPGP